MSDIIIEQLPPLPPSESLDARKAEHKGKIILAQQRFLGSVKRLREKGELNQEVREYGDGERYLATAETVGLFIDAMGELGFHESLSVKILDKYEELVRRSKESSSSARDGGNPDDITA